MFKVMSDIRETATGRVGSVVFDESNDHHPAMVGVYWKGQVTRDITFVDPNTLEQAEFGAALSDDVPAIEVKTYDLNEA